MANIPLQSISFPGLSDKYTTPVVDNTLTQTGAAADAKKTGDELAGLKNDLNQFPNGNYPEMGAGYANQLVSGLKKEDQTPYNFRAVPYDATLEEVKKIVGGTIVNNQLIDPVDAITISGIAVTSSNGIFTFSGTAEGGGGRTRELNQNTINVVTGHKYVVITSFDKAIFTGIYVTLLSDITQMMTFGGSEKDIKAATFSGSVAFGINTIADRAYSESGYFMLCDLTQAFGTTIADYVLSLETATAGAGVAWLKTHFPKQFNSGYQAYDAGTLKSIEGLSGKKTVGFNQWDEVAEVGGISESTGADWSTNDRIRSKNFIPVFPNTVYYIKAPTNIGTLAFYDADKNFISALTSISANYTRITPKNAWYIKFNMPNGYGTTYNHDICINLSDPTKNGTYKPYEAHSYALDSDVVLRGIPKLDSNNSLYYDGDEYLPDGTVNRRYGIVDLGTLSWGYLELSGNSCFVNYDLLNMKCGTVNDYKPNMVVNGFIVCSRDDLTSVISYDAITNNVVGHLIIATSKYGTDASAFKTAMSGVYLVYELATPTTETADPYTTPQIVSPDGTEEYVYTDGAFELPVGHTSDYPVDVSGQLDDILDTPSANGTYTLKATVTDGAVTYSWVADA